MTPSYHYRKFYNEFYTQNMKENKTTRGWEVSNCKRRKDM
jgi:hypothetical protein